jgi:hypothetical protein
MQQTRATQENIDVAWAELAKADLDAEKAAENRQKIMEQMEEFRRTYSTAVEKRNLDDAITQFRKGEDKQLETEAADTDIGKSPFNGR